MPRWEAVATFTLVAFVLSTLFNFGLLAVLRPLAEKLDPPDLMLLLLAWWLIPGFALMGLAISSNVWRRERPIVDALILTPICILMPAIAVIAFAIVACVSGGCS